MGPQTHSRVTLPLQLVEAGLGLLGLVVLAILAVGVGGDKGDAPARLARSEFRQTVAELPLPPATLKGRIDGIYERARSATTPGVAFGAHVLLITGDMTRLADACAPVPPL